MALDPANNEVRVILGGGDIHIVKAYRVSLGLLTVPARFSLELGHRDVVRQLMDVYPPGTDFELQIAGVRQFVGKTDGWNVRPSSEGTSLELIGRDALAPLHDTTVTAEKSFVDVSILEFVRSQLDEVYGAGKYKLLASNDANRKAISGTTSKAKATPSDAAALEDFDASIFKGAKDANKKIQAKLGMRRYSELLKPHLDRLGLFLWALGNGDFVLTKLNAKQAPLYRIRHRRGAIGNVVKGFSFRHTTDQRFSRCQVWGRTGGGAETRTKVSGEYVDQEMTDLGFDRPLVLQDDKVTSIEKAEFLARRKIAETRRNGWQLSYTVAGHTTIDVDGDVAIWGPDLVVDVDDEELGIFGPHFIESVEHAGDPLMSTTIHLMRPEDVLFGEEA